MTGPSTETLHFRARLLYQLTPVTEQDMLFALLFTDTHVVDGDRVLFGGPGLSLVASVSRHGYSAAVHTAVDAEVMRQQERALLADLAALNQALEQQGEALRYELRSPQILPALQGGRASPGPLLHDFQPGSSPHVPHPQP